MEGKISKEHSGGHAENGSAGSSRGPLGGSEGKKDVRTRSANWWRSNLALGRDRIKHSEQYRAPQSMTSTMKETKKLSSYVGW